LERDDGFDTLLLDALLGQIPSGVLVAEAPSGRIIRWNRQLEKIWRMPIPSACQELAAIAGRRPDGTSYAPEEWPLARALAGELTEPEEIEIERGDGTRGLVRVSAGPVRDAGGRPVAAVATFLDITEERRRFASRQLLAQAGSLLSSAPDCADIARSVARLAVPALGEWSALDLIGPDGALDRMAVEHVDRRKARSLTQLARRHPPTLKTEIGVAGVLRSGRSEIIHDVDEQALERFTTSAAQRKLLRELGIASAMIVPLLARGEPLGALVLGSSSGRRYSAEDLELAEEVAAQAALAIENCRLLVESRAADEAKSDFLAVMSHELRTPLTAVIGFAELLQLGVPEPVTPGQREQAERIEVSARHLLQLIEEILTLVTLESGESRVRHEEVNVNALLTRAATIIEPMARAKELALEVVPAEGDPILHSDPDKLLQILLNLLSNAVKFTEAGQVRLIARHLEGALLLEVIDTGIGLDPGHRQRIFDPFWQVERPITRRASGTGLGLTISRRLADLLGAELEVESEAGQGSTFRVRLDLG
jgi:signal transduction histidine kinase